MNAIEEVERIEELRRLVGDAFSVLSYKSLRRLSPVKLLTLNDDVREYYLHTPPHVAIGNEEELIRSYWYDVCDALEAHELNTRNINFRKCVEGRLRSKFGL